MKLLMSFMLLVLATLASADEPMLKETPYVYVKGSIGKGKPYFLEVGSESCRSCKEMGRLLYRVTKKYPTYNIVFINVKKERQAAYDLKIQMIPTQLIFDESGKEVYRHVGPLTTDALLALFKSYGFDVQ